MRPNAKDLRSLRWEVVLCVRKNEPDPDPPGLFVVECRVMNLEAWKR